MKPEHIIAIFLVIAGAILILAYTGILQFIIGTTYALLLINMVYYISAFFASFIASYLIRRAFGPVIDEAINRIKGVFKRGK